MTNPLPKIRRLGPKTIGRLGEIGIHTQADLEDMGAVEAYKRLKALYPDKITLNALWGLQAAILNIDWNTIPLDMRAELRAQAEDI